MRQQKIVHLPCYPCERATVAIRLASITDTRRNSQILGRKYYWDYIYVARGQSRRWWKKGSPARVGNSLCSASNVREHTELTCETRHGDAAWLHASHNNLCSDRVAQWYGVTNRGETAK